jgi:hypothetical protein
MVNNNYADQPYPSSSSSVSLHANWSLARADDDTCAPTCCSLGVNLNDDLSCCLKSSNPGISSSSDCVCGTYYCFTNNNVFEHSAVAMRGSLTRSLGDTGQRPHECSLDESANSELANLILMCCITNNFAHGPLHIDGMPPTADWRTSLYNKRACLLAHGQNSPKQRRAVIPRPHYRGSRVRP